MEDHRIWCDKFNLGVTHFGLHYDLFNIERIVYDTLHLKLATTQKIISFIKFMIENRSVMKLSLCNYLIALQ